MWFYNIKKSEIIPLWFIFKLLILIYLEFILLRLSPGFFSTIDSTATSEKISWYFQVSHDYIGQNPMAISHTDTYIAKSFLLTENFQRVTDLGRAQKFSIKTYLLINVTFSESFASILK